MVRLLVILVGAVTLLGCSQHPYRAFAVQVAWAPPPPTSTNSASGAAKKSPASAAAPASDSAPVAKAAATTPARAQLRPRHPQWDLNRVGGATLATLPGISRAQVTAVLAGRPYAAKRDLLRRKILTPEEYTRWKDYLVVHRRTTTVTKAHAVAAAGR